MYQQVIKKIGLGIVLSLAFTSVWASTLNEAQLKEIKGLKKAALNSTLAYEIDESLTTEVGARMIGSKGDKLAIQWAQAKMKSLGFDKVWTEPATFPKWIRYSESAAIVSPAPQAMHITALGNSISTPKDGI
ncbi:MAG: peptidase M28 family protein, partial [Psychrosphaera sp.]|nr:peptidase M28 family protein [Psychrosphaera sp.]